MFLEAAAVALLLAALAFVAPSLLLRLPLRRFPRARLLRYVVLVGLLAFLLTVFLDILAGLVGMPSAAAPALAAVLSLVVVMASMRQLWPLRRAQSLATRLARDPTSAETRRALLALARPRGASPFRGHEMHAALVLSVVGALADARLWEDATVLLEALDPEPLSPSLRATHALSLANCRLYSGDAEGARSLIESIPRPAPHPLTEEAAVASEALLLSLDGSPRQALARLDALGAPREPRLARAHDIARAHAHEALGESERARDALRRLREAHGRDGLLRVQALRGPASPLATALLAETDTPYRG